MNFLENGRIPSTRQNYVAKRRALSGQTSQSRSSEGVNNKLRRGRNALTSITQRDDSHVLGEVLINSVVGNLGANVNSL